MQVRRTFRVVAIVAAAALVVGAFGLPADAKKRKKKKPKPTPTVFACAPGTYTEAPDAEVVKITDAATEAAPVVIEFSHGPSGPVGQTHESLYFNIQLETPNAAPGLYIREEFSERHDIDLSLFDSAGEEVDSSGAFNAAPVNPGPEEADLSSGGRGGEDFESIPGFAGASCGAYTIESSAYATPGTDAVLKIWLGEPAPAE